MHACEPPVSISVTLKSGGLQDFKPDLLIRRALVSVHPTACVEAIFCALDGLLVRPHLQVVLIKMLL